jgi:ABC-2 type transport system ATP-binding protein
MSATMLRALGTSPGGGVDTAVSYLHVTVVQAGHRLLDDVTFEVSRGITVALLGPPGAGKTTAIETGLGIRPLDGGTIRLLGQEPEAAIASGRVGAVLPSLGLPSGARVGQLLDFARVLHDAPLPVDDLVDRAGLGSLMGRPTDRLSRSEAQQLMFALALAGDPDLLFLDEPAAHLDLQARSALWRNLERLTGEGRTLLLATRDPDVAASRADHVIMLEGGRLGGEGDVEATRARLADRGPASHGSRPAPLDTRAGARGDP